MPATYIGQPLSRIDGHKKVTGRATYAAEFDLPDLAYAAAVRSTIPCGRIAAIDSSAAERAPGVLHVLTHRNAARLPYDPQRGFIDPPSGERLHMLQDERVLYHGQPVALVVAETLEQAWHAATLVKVDYAEDAGSTDVATAARVAPRAFDADPATMRPAETSRGDPAAGFAQAAIQVDAYYEIPRENHNPIEPHVTVAAWDADELTLWDKTQFIPGASKEIAAVFGMAPDKVHVISPFVGGAFGCALRTWPHVTLAALGARTAGRPVKLMMTRREMYYGTGFRPHTVQHIRMGAGADGRLSAIDHEGVQEASSYEEYSEALLETTRFLYSCPNVHTRHQVAPMNVHTPTWMRAPGEVSGNFALECALDELAAKLGIDPLELRIRNEPARDESSNLPFSSRATLECYRIGAERFGWSRRDPRPRSMRDGRMLIGWGMATANYPVFFAPASARVRLLPDGSAEVMCAASDMGPGTWTSVTQVAADALGLPIEQVRFTLGDSRLPAAPPHGGSMTMASVGSAVQGACRKACAQALASTGATELAAALGQLKQPVDVTYDNSPSADDAKNFSRHAFGAVFAEVAVDPDLCETRVRRLVGVYGAGRIVNPKLARSQCEGGMFGGIGMALMEHTVVDPRNGRITNANLAEYGLPVHADAPSMDVIFVDEVDPHVNPLGVKGLGEIAMVGVPPAIVNAIFHATGKRMRTLPVTPDRLL